MSKQRQSTIMSDAFAEWLKSAGIIPERTSRVVIEARVREPVRIYVEMFGTEGLISVEPPPELCGAQIVIAEKSSDLDEALGTWGR